MQCLLEILERAVKKQILEEELVLPYIPQEVLARGTPGLSSPRHGHTLG